MSAVNYLWNPINDNIVEEFDDAGNTIAEYTTEPDQFGDVISQYRDGQESFYHTDGQGSTLALTNSSGDITDTYSYSAFGEVTAQNGGTVNPFQYIGQKQYYRDAETGEYDVRRRPLDADQGRWLSMDPQPAFGELNLYLYSLNSPIRYNDPSGLRPVCCDVVYRGWPGKWTIDCHEGWTALECCQQYHDIRTVHRVIALEGRCADDKPAKPKRPPPDPSPGFPFPPLFPKSLPAPPPTIPVLIGTGVFGGITLWPNTCQAPEGFPQPQPQPWPKPVKLPPIGWPIDLPRGRRDKWTCMCKCNVHKINSAPPETRCPNTVDAFASGPNENAACDAACDIARGLSPRGCQTKHCGCKNRCVKT